MNFSLEIGPHADLNTLPSVKDVYVTMLPGGDYKDTAEKSMFKWFFKIRIPQLGGDGYSKDLGSIKKIF